MNEWDSAMPPKPRYRGAPEPLAKKARAAPLEKERKFLVRAQQIFAADAQFLSGSRVGRMAVVTAACALPAYAWYAQKDATTVLWSLAPLILLGAPLLVLLEVFWRMVRIRQRGWWDHLLVTPILPSLWSDFVLAKSLSVGRPVTRALAHGLVVALCLSVMDNPPNSVGDVAMLLALSLPVYAFVFLPMTMYWSRMEYAARDAAERFLYEALDRTGWDGWIDYITRGRLVESLPTIGVWCVSMLMLELNNGLWSSGKMGGSILLLLGALALPVYVEAQLLRRARARERRTWPELLELGYEPGGFGPPTLIDKGLADIIAQHNRRH